MNLFKHEMSLKEAKDFILACGSDVPTILLGQPGVGKTSMFDEICKETGYRGVYMNVPELDIGDIGIPMPNHETKTTSLYPNEYWGFHIDEPAVIFMDEFTKGADAVQKILHPIINEGRIGSVKINKKSIVILTGNNSTDGVGDMLKAHSINRVTIIPIRNPYSEEWIEWATDNGVNPLVITAAKQFPEWFASYKDSEVENKENHEIFNPKRGDEPFVSCRSLAKSGKIVDKRHLYTENALRVGLAGTIGKTAAEKMASYFIVADSLPPWDEIIANPTTAKLPESPAAQCMLAYSAIQRVDRESITKWFTYMKRASSELQSVFCLSGLASNKEDLLMSSKAFVDWMREKQYLF